MRGCLTWAVLALALGACGGGNGTGDGGGADGGGTDDPCGFQERYLPQAAGYSWTYRVVDLSSGEQTEKSQYLEASDERPELGDDVLRQVTNKDSGQTVSFVTVRDDTVLRLVQEDYDALGALQRTTTYDPGQARLFETADRLEAGATWSESYLETEYDAAGALVSEVTTTEEWEVISADAECESPLGTFRCLHVRRVRTAGGIADKQYFFARGIGKIKEIGSKQIEELVACE